MPAYLPPLRLTGGLALRDGTLQQRTIALNAGRFTTGPFPAVDLSGFYLMPGVVDLHATGFQHHFSENASGLSLVDREAASHGVTTRYLSQPWSWERFGTSPEAARDLTRLVASRRGETLTDLRLQLNCERMMVAQEDALLDLVKSCGVDQVIFSNRAEIAAELRQNHPEEFTRWAWSQGTQAEALSKALDRILPNAPAVPRHLCRLAEAFDELGVVYGSADDDSAETREHYSMIGARICLNPGTARVAAAARAVGDPVVVEAEDILQPKPGRRGPRVTELLEAGLCNALVSGRHSASLVQAAFALVEEGVMGLERAWALISAKPAEILRLPDRGVIAPGKRADLTVINAETRMVEATICGGRITFLTGEAATRFLGAEGSARLAAE